jgi:prepilin-type N-terminal cleavage/methylation domain-containing protein
MTAAHRFILGRRKVRRRGLTLVEVLATIVMVAIVLPAAMQGISMCLSASRDARQRSEASALAEAKLNEILATGDWQFGALSGDFGEAWPEYHWGGGSTSWPSDSTMAEVYVRVTWTARQQEREVVLSTLVYQGSTSTASAE